MVTITNIYSPPEEVQDFEFIDEEIIEDEVEDQEDRIIRLMGRQSASDITRMYRRANGSLTYRAVGGQQEFTANIQNGNDAMLIARILLDSDSINRNRLSAGYRRIYDLVRHSNGGSELFFELENEADGRPLNEYFQEIDNNTVINPKTGRIIAYLGSTYKKIFKSIRLRKNGVNESVTNFECEDYTMMISNELFNDNNNEKYCVPSYINSIRQSLIGKKVKKLLFNELKKNKIPTCDEFTKLLNKHNIGLIVYIIDREEISENNQNEYKKKLKILVHNGHLYKVTHMYKQHKVKKLDEDQYYEQYRKVLNNYEIQGSDEYSFTFKKNKYVLDSGNKFKKMNEIFNLMGKYSQVNVDFYENCGIRPIQYFNNDVNWGTNIDIKECYKNIMCNPKLKFALTSGTEYVKEFKKQSIIDYRFYLCKFNKKDDIQEAIYPLEQHWIAGHIIKKYKLDVNIKYEYVVKYFKSGEKNGKKIDNDLVRQYSGLLGRYITTKKTSYYIDDDKEMEAMKKKYGRKKSYQSFSTFNVLNNNYKLNSGMLSYLSIFSHCHSQLMDLYYAVKKEYPDIKIKKIRTDCIGFNKKIYLKKIKVDFGIRDEKKRYNMISSRMSNRFDHEQYLLKKINKLNKSDFMNVIKNNESLFVTGPAGVGKSFTTKNDIIKYFNDNDIKYLTTSSTKENALDWDNENSVQHYIRKSLGNETIKEILKKYKYIIIDECTQLTMKTLLILEFLKRSNLNIILLGDRHQCRSTDGIDYTTSMIFNKLVDFNQYEIKYHEKCRYTKEYYDFTQKFPTMKIGRLRKYIKDNIKRATVNEMKNNINVCYTHLYGKQITEKLKQEYNTIHSYQGKTIKDLYIIHEIDRILDYRILYTAFTRSTGFDNVRYYQVKKKRIKK